jgi:hypothetical protein
MDANEGPEKIVGWLIDHPPFIEMTPIAGAV